MARRRPAVRCCMRSRRSRLSKHCSMASESDGAGSCSSAGKLRKRNGNASIGRPSLSVRIVGAAKDGSWCRRASSCSHSACREEGSSSASSDAQRRNVSSLAETLERPAICWASALSILPVKVESFAYSASGSVSRGFSLSCIGGGMNVNPGSAWRTRLMLSVTWRMASTMRPSRTSVRLL